MLHRIFHVLLLLAMGVTVAACAEAPSTNVLGLSASLIFERREKENPFAIRACMHLCYQKDSSLAPRKVYLSHL